MGKNIVYVIKDNLNGKYVVKYFDDARIVRYVNGTNTAKVWVKKQCAINALNALNKHFDHFELVGVEKPVEKVLLQFITNDGKNRPVYEIEEREEVVRDVVAEIFARCGCNSILVYKHFCRPIFYGIYTIGDNGEIERHGKGYVINK